MCSPSHQSPGVHHPTIVLVLCCDGVLAVAVSSAVRAVVCYELVSIECIAVLQSFLCLLLPQLLLLHGSNTISFYRHFSSIYQFYHHAALLALCGNVSTLPGVMWCDVCVCANVGGVRRGRGVWTDNPHVCTYCEGVLLSPVSTILHHSHPYFIYEVIMK